MNNTIVLEKKEDLIVRFVNLTTSYMGRPKFGDYSSHWENLKSRNSILFSICLMEYVENETTSIRRKLNHLMKTLSEDSEIDAQIGYECMNYLLNLKE